MAGATDPKAHVQTLVVTFFGHGGVSVFLCFVTHDPKFSSLK